MPRLRLSLKHLLPSRAQAFAMALALLGLLGHVSALAHLALVRHVRCEHGDLVEVAGAETLRYGVATPEIGRSSVPDSSSGHQHCTIAPLPRERTLPTAPVVSASALDSPVISVACDCQPPLAPPIALLLLAPKNSPPA